MTGERSIEFSNLMEKLGNFLFHWSRFELALSETITARRKQLKHPNADIRGGLGERLDLWIALDTELRRYAPRTRQLEEIRDQALALREERNLIVHGLRGGDATPDDGARAYLCCVVGGFEDPTGEVRKYTIAELEHLIQAIDACRRGILSPDSFNYRI